MAGLARARRGGAAGPGGGIALADLDTAVDLVVTRALSAASSIRLGTDDPVVEPDVLRRRDGGSEYRVVGATLYTSPAIIDAETRLLAAGQRRDERAISDITVGVALAESAANGLELNRLRRNWSVNSPAREPAYDLQSPQPEVGDDRDASPGTGVDVHRAGTSSA